MTDPYDASIEALRQAVHAMPENATLRALLAGKLLEAGRFAEAESEFRLALRAEPGNEASTLGLVQALEARGEQAEALAIFDGFARVAEISAAARLRLARMLLAGGRPLEAAEQYRTVLEQDPELADEFLARRLGISSSGAHREPIPAGGGSPAAGPLAEIERPRTTFADVGGMDEVKEQVRLKIILPLAQPELFRAYGKAVGGGILLFGPPGCGKTHLARATAGEASASFCSVGIHDVLEMWIGQSERNLHAIFEDARRRKPCVLFFDEVDALGARRADLSGGAGRHVINQFLAELDGVESSNDGLLVLAATNAPWHMDTAFLRAGRFDRLIFVPPPDAPARARILETLVRGKPTEGLDVEAIARQTDGFSGADLKAVVDQAIERKIAEAVQSGRPTPLRTADLRATAKSVRPTTRDWFATARNYVLYANQGGVYDDVRAHLGLE